MLKKEFIFILMLQAITLNAQENYFNALAASCKKNVQENKPAYCHMAKGTAYLATAVGLPLALNALNVDNMPRVIKLEKYMLGYVMDFVRWQGWATSPDEILKIAKDYTYYEKFNLLSYPLLVCVCLPLTIKAIKHFNESRKLFTQKD